MTALQWNIFSFQEPHSYFEFNCREDHQDFFLKHKPKAYHQRNNYYVQETNLSEAYYQRNNYYVQETNLRCWNGLKGTKKGQKNDGKCDFQACTKLGFGALVKGEVLN